MPSIMSPPTDAQPEARVTCPNCGAAPAQRIDMTVGRETVAACVCQAGHLFVIQWEASV